MNKGSDRREAVVKMVKQEQSIKITELSRRLGVSSMTIRRDLERLSDAGLIKVLYGAVFFTGKDETNPLTEYRLSEAQTLQVEEKKRIALYAAGLIKEGDILFLDAGSTTYYLAKYLPEEFPFTVICYSLNIFLAVSEHRNVELILAGGVYNPQTTILEQPEPAELFSRNRAAKAFISAGGIHPRLGVTCSAPAECEMKKAALAGSAERILLADSSKYGRVTSCYFAEPEDFDKIITDAPPKEGRYPGIVIS